MRQDIELLLSSHRLAKKRSVLIMYIEKASSSSTALTFVIGVSSTGIINTPRKKIQVNRCSLLKVNTTSTMFCLWSTVFRASYFIKNLSYGHYALTGPLITSAQNRPIWSNHWCRMLDCSLLSTDKTRFAVSSAFWYYIKIGFATSFPFLSPQNWFKQNLIYWKVCIDVHFIRSWP